MKNLCMVVLASFMVLACEDPTQESPIEDTEESNTTIQVVEVSTEEVDLCPNHPGKTSPGECGCHQLDVHSDSDSVADCNDQCPFNSNLTEPNAWGGSCCDIGGVAHPYF